MDFVKMILQVNYSIKPYAQMKKEILEIIKEIKAEGLDEAYNDGIAVPNNQDSLLEALDQ